MWVVKFVFYIFIPILLVSGCAKKAPSAQSKITLQMPSHVQQKSGMNSFASNACFAVSIKGSGLTSVASNTCDPEYGLFAGLASPGASIELETSYGLDRSIEIYYVISDNGCNSFNPTLGLGETYGSNKVHRISRTTGVNFDQPEVVVEVQIDWPSTSNSFASLFSPPDSCKKGDDPINLMAIKQARVVQGAGRGFTQSGSQVQVRILDQKLDMRSPDNWSGRILPNRLGDEQ